MLRAIAARLFDRISEPLARRLYPHVENLAAESLPLRSFEVDIANFVVFNQVPGDYLEFGVYRGDGLASYYRAIKEQWARYVGHAEHFGHAFEEKFFDQKRFIAFDSFAGLPHEEAAPDHFRGAGIYTISEQAFWTNVERRNVPRASVRTVPGFFDVSLTPEVKTQHAITAASVIFIDCDLYSSAVPVMRFVTPLVVDGTVIVLDDYFRYKGRDDSGVQGAFNEWRRSNPDIGVQELARTSANRVAFICSRK